MFSPSSISKGSKLDQKDDHLPDLDATTQAKAEGRYQSFYEVYTEPDPVAQGPASFN